MAKGPERCEWIDLRDALCQFVAATYGTTSQRHIRPLHWYMSCRLCLEGGFLPEEITPRPPFRVTMSSSDSKRRLIEYAPELGGSGEQTILGGLRTKQVDVVVTKPSIGPVIAISMKGTLNAFRNLTNRLEEAGGDCTNLHITYPALVYGYWAVIRANRPGPIPTNAPRLLHTDDGLVRRTDLALNAEGLPQPCIIRYHQALSGLTARNGIRDDVSKYETVALSMVNVSEGDMGTLNMDYPPRTSLLRFEQFLKTVYTQYDLRFVYQAPDLAARTYRIGWDESSPALQDWRIAEYHARLRASEDEIAEMSDGSSQ